jgi:hypothetical protein
MKIRLGRGATIAAGAVAASLFVLLCMLFYGREDYLAPERVLERSDALRFRIAASLVEPLGAGAYLALGLVFAWSVVAYFRESVGALVPRLVGIAACVPSFCGLTSLASEPHEFWAGSLGVWMGDVAFRGFGPVLAWAVVGSLFLVSFALATEFGFHGQLRALRGTLSFPLVPPAEPETPAGTPLARASSTALLEPGTEVPAEPWALPAPDLSGGDGSGDDSREFADARVVDREEHLADVRARLAAGGTVTEAERRLLEEARASDAVGAAIDALFTAAPPAAPAAAPVRAAPALPDLPPFLLPGPHSQEIRLEGIPTTAAAAPAAPAEAPSPSAPEGGLHPTEEKDPAPAPAPGRGRYVFAGVEFLPPNEELADPLAPAAPAAAAAEPLAALPSGTAALPSIASSVAPSYETPAAAAEAPVPAPAPSGAPAPASQEFEDEIFAFGFESEAAAAAPSPAGVAPPEGIPALPAVVADALSAPVEAEPAPAEDASWLLAAARDLGLEPVADVEEDLAAGVEIPARGGLTAEEAAEAIVASLHDLFGAPVPPAATAGPEAPAVPEAAAEKDPPALAAHGWGTLFPFMLDEEILAPEAPAPVVDEAVPAFAPPPAPAGDDPTHLPALAAAPAPVPAESEEFPEAAPAGEPEAPEPRTYEPEPMTIEPDYIPNQDPEPGEIVRASSGAAPAPEIVEEVFSPPSLEPAEEIFEGEPVEESPAPDGEEPAAEPDAEEPPAAPVDEVLARLFGEPVPRSPSGEAPAPAGPVQPEPREPPANLQPLLDAVAEQVTLLTDPSVADCVRDHGIEMEGVHDEQVLVPPPSVVEDDAPQAAPEVPPAPSPVDPAGEPEEEEAGPAVDQAFVDSLVADFRAAEPETVVEEEVPAAPAPAAAPTEEEDLYARAVEAVRERGRGSVIVLQRKLGIGYTRAVRLLESLQENGVVGPENASGSHPVLE